MIYWRWYELAILMKFDHMKLDEINKPFVVQSGQHRAQICFVNKANQLWLQKEKLLYESIWLHLTSLSSFSMFPIAFSWILQINSFCERNS